MTNPVYVLDDGTRLAYLGQSFRKNNKGEDVVITGSCWRVSSGDRTKILRRAVFYQTTKKYDEKVKRINRENLSSSEIFDGDEFADTGFLYFLDKKKIKKIGPLKRDDSKLEDSLGETGELEVDDEEIPDSLFR